MLDYCNDEKKNAHVALSICHVFISINLAQQWRKNMTKKTTVLKIGKCWFFKNYFTLIIDLFIQLRNCTLWLLKFIIYILILSKNNDPNQKVSKKYCVMERKQYKIKVKSCICSIRYIFRCLDYSLYRHIPKQVSTYRILIFKFK